MDLQSEFWFSGLTGAPEDGEPWTRAPAGSRMGPSPRIRLVGELTAERPANEAGVEATLVRRLAALGILKPERPDRYVAGDVVRVETVNAFLNAGITLDEIAAAVATGTFTFDYIDLFYTPPSERSARTYEAFARSLGSRAGLLPALYAAMGLPEPSPESHLRTDEEGLIQKFLEAWKQAGDEETYSRAARMAGEGARTVSEGWVDLFVEKISGPLEAAGIDRRKAIDVIIRTGPRVATLPPKLLLWLPQRP